MITCDAARALLLEAEPAELRGEAESPLALHVRSCLRCRQRAAFLLAETDTLRSTLDASRPPLRTVERGPGGEAIPRPGTGSKWGSRKRRWQLLVPLALAAGIAGLLLARRHQTGAPAAPVQVAVATPPALDVQVPVGQSVAVFQTANPNIVVIWSY